MIKKKAFIRYLFSYVLVLIIPITIICYFIYFQFIVQFKEEVTSSATKVLEQTRDATDKHLESFAGITSNLSTNSHISYLLSQDNVENLSIYPYILNAIKELNKYKNANSIIENIFIIFKDGNIVISDSSRYNLETFTESVFRLNDIKSENFVELLNSIYGETILPLKNATYNKRKINVISYIQTLPIKDISPKAILMMTIDEASLKQSMENSLKKYEGYACVFDSDNNIVMSAEFGNFKFNENEKNILLSEISNQNEDSYTISKQGYVISSVKSQKNNWKYVSFIPSANIFTTVRSIQQRMVEIIILTLLLGMLVILYLSKKDYYKIKKIINSIKGYEQNSVTEGANGYRSEWDLINETIVNYVSKNEALQEKIYQQIPMMRNSFFSRLINGSINDENNINDMLEFLDMDLKKQFFGVFIIETDINTVSSVSNVIVRDDISVNHKLMKEVVQATLTDIVQKVVGKDCFIYTLEDQKHTIDIIIGICNEERNDEKLVDNTKYLQEVAYRVKELVKKNLGFTVTIGIGGLYNNLLQLGDSYSEASKALEYKILMGYNSVISYDAICSRGAKRVCYSFEQEKELVSLIKIGAYEEIQNMLDKIVNIIKSEPVNLDSIKFIYFDIINTAMKAADEINIESSSVEAYMEELTHMETLDEIYNSVSDFYKKLCSEIKASKISKSIELRDKVIEYINDKYYDNMLSVDGIADYFYVTPSYMSRYMKDHLGYSITDYIHEVRLQKAKWLLQNTEKTVALIAEEVGYNSLHNFSRVFKRYERITPTDYRTII